MGESTITYESIGVGLLKYSSLMGNFPAPVPQTLHHIIIINIISTMVHQSLKSFDPCIIPSCLEFYTLRDSMSLSLAEAKSDSIQSASPSSDDQHLVASNYYSLPYWLNSLSFTFD